MNENHITPQTPANPVPAVPQGTTAATAEQPTDRSVGLQPENPYNPAIAVLQLAGPILERLPSDLPQHYKRALLLLANQVQHQDVAKVLGMSESWVNHFAGDNRQLILEIRQDTKACLQHVVSNVTNLALDKIHQSLLNLGNDLTPAQISQVSNAVTGLMRATAEVASANKTGNNRGGLPLPRSLEDLDSALNKVRGLKA